MAHTQHPDNSPQSQPPQPPPRRPRRSDAGKIRLQTRDVAGLVLTAEMYAAPADLLAQRLKVTPARMRDITARWRGAGLADTGRLAPGPQWCWLTPDGMSLTGFDWTASRPALSRLAHIRAVMAARIWMEADEAWQAHRAWWRCERRIWARRPPTGSGHIPDAEIVWPSLPASPSAGQRWCVEVELTPKAAGRTSAILAGLLDAPYDMAVYLCAPAALPVVRAAAGRLPPDERQRILIRDLPPGALMDLPS
jgi:hypothetical protein